MYTWADKAKDMNPALFICVVILKLEMAAGMVEEETIKQTIQVQEAVVHQM